MFVNDINKIKRMTAVLALMLAVSTMLAPFGHAQSSRYTVEIENHSIFDIHEVYLSPSSSSSWRSDRLGDNTLPSGYRFTTHVPRTGLYDLRLVDEYGDVCEVLGVAVNGNTTWSISNQWLLNCQFRRH